MATACPRARRTCHAGNVGTYTRRAHSAPGVLFIVPCALTQAFPRTSCHSTPPPFRRMYIHRHALNVLRSSSNGNSSISRVLNDSSLDHSQPSTSHILHKLQQRRADKKEKKKRAEIVSYAGQTRLEYRRYGYRSGSERQTGWNKTRRKWIYTGRRVQYIATYTGRVGTVRSRKYWNMRTYGRE
jgi:hypothetical protein